MKTTFFLHVLLVVLIAQASWCDDDDSGESNESNEREFSSSSSSSSSYPGGIVENAPDTPTGGGMVVENEEDTQDSEDGEDNEDTDMEENVGQATPDKVPVVDPCKLKCYYSYFTKRVCGTDGVTYPSDCHLTAARCYRPNVALAQQGPCPYHIPKAVTQNPSSAPTKTSEPVTQSPSPAQTGTSEPPAGELTTALGADLTTFLVLEDALEDSAEVEKKMGTTTPRPVACPDSCALIRELVCGTDGETYQSACILQTIACVRNDHTLQVASEGECPMDL